MIAEGGLAALWLAASAALLQVLAGLLTARGLPGWSSLTRAAAVAQAALAALAMLALIIVFTRTDLSVRLVYENSHAAKPMLYKVAGAWGNHEGSMLLWVTVLALSGGLVALLERRLPPAMLHATLAAQGGIALGFYAFLLFASNPFARLSPAPLEGLGLNPLLQDPGLAFHPPTLYLGYVGLSVAFSFAVGALVVGEVDRRFARAMRPWVLGAWTFLTLGITAGSYWAYYELGWGGYWFWDPVENASLMPWLAATALLHSVSVLAVRDSLRAWTVMLAVVAFSMSMVGTFLVRSGVLTSVHAFAIDPRRGDFILALLALYIGGALALFGWRIGTVREGERFDAVSREGALVVNNLLLSVILGIVLIGTLYPLVTEAMGMRISVGAPYFDATIGPIALLLLALIASGPLLRWRRDAVDGLGRKLAVPGTIAALVLILLPLVSPGMALLPWLALGLACGVGVASLAPLWGRNLRRTPLFTWGMVLAHLGCAVSVAGMAADSAFTREILAALAPGESRTIGPWTVWFIGVRPTAGANFTAVEAEFEAKRGGTLLLLHPQARAFFAPVTETSETAIATRMDGQLYTVLGKPAAGGRWQVRLWWKPMVTLIWAGGALIAAGGALSLVGRVARGWRGRRMVGLGWEEPAWTFAPSA